MNSTPIKVLSLCDGISALRIALESEGISIDKYYAFESDYNLIKCALLNHPSTVKMGDIHSFKPEKSGGIDLLVGFNCVDIEVAAKRKLLANVPSADFWHYIRIMKVIKPKYFIFVAVSPKYEDIKVITEQLDVFATEINHKLLSPVSQRVLYWTNISGGDCDLFNKPILHAPENTNTILQSILEYGYAPADKAKPITANDVLCSGLSLDELQQKVRSWKTAPNIIFDTSSKLMYEGFRVMTKTEIERLFGYPDGYTSMLTLAQAFKAFTGNYSVPTLRYILSKLKQEGI